MSIYCPLSKALGIEYIPSEHSSYSPSQKEFDPSYMGNCGIFNAFYGKKHTEETKQVIREKRAKQVITEETRKKMSLSQKGRVSPMKGRNHTEEHRQKISNIMVGRSKPKIVCPHCGKEGGLPQMKQWHFDNCKEKR